MRTNFLLAFFFGIAAFAFGLSVQHVSAQSCSVFDSTGQQQTGTCKSVVACTSGDVYNNASQCSGGTICCVTPLPTSPNAPADSSSTSSTSGSCEGQTVGGICIPSNTGLSQASISDILARVAGWLLGIFAILGLIAFVISGLQYLLASGNEEIIETAKRHMKWSIVGVIVGLSGVIIIRIIESLLKGGTSSGLFF